MLPELPSIAEAQTLMRRGKLRPIDLVEHCLGRIHQFEDQIHAWVMVDEEGARNEARRLGKMLDDGQEPVGPLHGIPIGIKDIIDVAGWPTLCGSKLREGHVAEKDAAVVASLRKAGAIILGKTVTTEWASFDPPPTRNPWNLNHTPGGSSSGSAAAVAMEMCMASLGTQTGGSIVRPASYCGVVGLKPSFGATSLEGVFPFSRHLDHLGPMGRSVSDIRTVYEILDEPLSSRGKPTLCFLEGGFVARADRAAQDATSMAREKLATRFSTHSIQLPGFFHEVHALHRCIMAVEAAAVHDRSFEANPMTYSKHIRSLIDEGRNTTARVYAIALFRQHELKDEFFRNWVGCETILALPSTATAAPKIDTTGDPVFNSPWSFLGVPEITIPLSLDGDLPLGLQLISLQVGKNCPLFDVAVECERILGFNQQPRLLTQK